MTTYLNTLQSNDNIVEHRIVQIRSCFLLFFKQVIQVFRVSVMCCCALVRTRVDRIDFNTWYIQKTFQRQYGSMFLKNITQKRYQHNINQAVLECSDGFVCIRFQTLVYIKKKIPHTFSSTCFRSSHYYQVFYNDYH